MAKITESEIEEFAIELLEKQSYQYIYAPSIAPDSDTPERQSFEDVLLIERLQTAVGRINPSIPVDIREDAIKQILRLNSPELIANNEAFHRMLTEGIKVIYQKDGNSRGDLVWLIGPGFGVVHGVCPFWVCFLTNLARVNRNQARSRGRSIRTPIASVHSP